MKNADMPAIGDTRIRAFIHPDAITAVEVYEVERYTKSPGKYAKPDSCYWHIMTLEPFVDYEQAASFMAGLKDDKALDESEVQS